MFTKTEKVPEKGFDTDGSVYLIGPANLAYGLVNTNASCISTSNTRRRNNATQ